MKIKDIKPGGRLFPFFWFEIGGFMALIILSGVLISLLTADNAKGGITDAIPTMGVAVPEDSGKKPSGESVELPTGEDKELTPVEVLQRELIAMYFSDEVYYGMAYGDGTITTEGFATLFYDSPGAEIGINEVRIGDCAIGSGISGICVGFYNHLPVFAYVSNYTVDGRKENPICFGYAREQSTDLFCGMYPVSFLGYCKGDRSEVTADSFTTNVAYMGAPSRYAEMAYEYGVLMSSCNADVLSQEIMEEGLLVNNVKLYPEKFKEFLELLPAMQGFIGGYDLMMDSLKYGEDYVQVNVQFLPHDAEEIKPVGSWALTLYAEEQKFLPCEVNFLSHPEVGFVRDKKITITTNEDGTVKVDREEIIYGQTVDENGRSIYRLEDGTIIYLE